MSLLENQFEMRSAFLGGFAGQLVSGIIWLIASALGLFLKPAAGMAALFFGSMGIFPLTQFVVRLLGRPGKVNPENGLWKLGSQVAFLVPINFLLVGAATLYRTEWFFPAAMVVVGSHYLPFITLYGMKIFGILGGILIVCGTMLSFYFPHVFSLGGWITGALMILFAFVGRHLVLKEENANK